MQEGFSCWRCLVLDHILARNLCSASLSRQRIPQAEGFYHSLYNCSKVRYDLQVLVPASCPCYQSGPLSWSVFFLGSYSQMSTSCCCPPKQWQSEPGISQWFGLSCISEALWSRGAVWSCAAADAMPRLGLCTTDPKGSNMLSLSLCMHSLMCWAGMVQPDGTRGIGTVIIRQLFFWFLTHAVCRFPWYCTTDRLAIPAPQRNPTPSNYRGRDTLATSYYFWHSGMCIASARGEFSACCSGAPRMPIIGWLRWVLTSCFPQRHRHCGEGFSVWRLPGGNSLYTDLSCGCRGNFALLELMGAFSL